MGVAIACVMIVIIENNVFLTLVSSPWNKLGVRVDGKCDGFSRD